MAPDDRLQVAQELTVTRLGGLIGAQVDGVDLDEDLTPEVECQLREALARHQVLVFRGGRDVSAQAQRRLAAVFGELQPPAPCSFLDADIAPAGLDRGASNSAAASTQAAAPGSYLLREDLQELGIEGEFDGWHNHSTFAPWISRVDVLRADATLPVGGDACFSSLRAAYDELSPAMQGWLEGLEALHIAPEGYRKNLRLDAFGPDAEARFEAQFPPRQWPLVIAHPETDRKILFVNPACMVHVAGLKRAESHSLIRFLCHHVASVSFIYRHHWQPGDIVVRDVVSTLHRMPEGYSARDRWLSRVAAGQVVPDAHTG